MAKTISTGIWRYIFITIAMYFMTVSLSVGNEVEPEDAYLGNSSSGGSSTSSSSLELTIERAMKQAQTSQHKFLTIEQVLLALLDEPSTRKSLEVNSVDIESVRAELSAHIQSNFSVSSNGGLPITHPALRQVLVRATMKTFSSNKKQTEGADILEAILVEDNSFAAQLLQGNGLSLELVANQALERYLARTAQQTEKHEKLLQKIEEQKKSNNSVRGTQLVAIETAPDQSESGDERYKSYILRVTSEAPEVVSFKAAVSHDGSLDLYIEETPYEIEFLASKLAALFEAIEGGTRLKVELVTEVNGQPRVVGGFGGSSGAIFKDPRSYQNQRSGRL